MTTSRQKKILWSLRGLFWSLLLLVIFQLNFSCHKKEQRKPSLLVLVDHSTSMQDAPLATIPLAKEETRAARVQQFLNSSQFETLQKETNLSLLSLEENGPRPFQHPQQELTFTSPSSPILEQIDSLLKNIPAYAYPKAILLLSDGLDSSGRQSLSSPQIPPIFCLELEKQPPSVSTEKNDFAIRSAELSPTLQLNWKNAIPVTLSRSSVSGEHSLIPITGTLILQEKSSSSEEFKELCRQSISFPPHNCIRHSSLEFTPKEKGVHQYRIRLELPQTGIDENPQNNQWDYQSLVEEGETRILYLEGVPRWEAKYLNRSINSEKSLRLRSFIHVGHGNFLSMGGSGNGQSQNEMGNKNMPAITPDYLRQFRLIILGNLSRQILTATQRKLLAQYVNDGGSLLFLGGTVSFDSQGIASTPELIPLLPVRYDPDQGTRMLQGERTIAFTPEARLLPSFAEFAQTTRLPPILSLWAPVALAPTAQPLLCTSHQQPVLVLGQYGSGRVAILLTDTLWRWHLQNTTKLSSDKEKRGLYQSLILQLIQLLAPRSQTLASSDTPPKQPAATPVPQSSSPLPIPQADWEKMALPANFQFLQNLCTSSRGQFLRQGEEEKLLKYLHSLPEDSLTLTQQWQANDSTLFVSLLLLLLCTEWFLRRKWGQK